MMVKIQRNTSYFTLPKTILMVPTVYKANFVHSRSCGTTPYECPNRECNTCSETGYTSELSYYSGANVRYVTVDSEAGCAAECDAELECVAVFYQKNIKRCYLRKRSNLIILIILWFFTLFSTTKSVKSNWRWVIKYICRLRKHLSKTVGSPYRLYLI